VCAEYKTRRTKHARLHLDDLKHRIKTEWAKLDHAVITASVHYRRRLSGCVKAGERRQSFWALFLPRDEMHKRGLCCHAVSVRMSVTFVDHVKTNKRISSKFFHHRVATPFQFFRTKGGADNPTGTPLTGASNARGMIKWRFFHNISLYLRNGYS